MSRREILANIGSYRRQIDDHKGKIRRNPRDRTVAHWQTEINNFEREVAKLERELTVEQSKMYCPNCRRDVEMNGNKCTICRLVIG